jgi:hypothetical protein
LGGAFRSARQVALDEFLVAEGAPKRAVRLARVRGDEVLEELLYISKDGSTPPK